MGVPYSRDIKYIFTDDHGRTVMEPWFRLANGQWVPYQKKDEYAQRLEDQCRELQQHRQYQHHSHQFQQQVQLYLQQLQQLQMQRMLPVNNFVSPAPFMANPAMYQPTPFGYSMPNQLYHPGGFFR